MGISRDECFARVKNHHVFSIASRKLHQRMSQGGFSGRRQRTRDVASDATDRKKKLTWKLRWDLTGGRQIGAEPESPKPFGCPKSIRLDRSRVVSMQLSGKTEVPRPNSMNHRKKKHTRFSLERRGVCALVPVCLFLLNGCSLADLKRDVETANEVGIFVVDTGISSSDTHTTVVIYSETPSGPTMQVRGPIGPSGQGIFIVPDLNMHRILVYRDVNADGQWTPGESGVLTELIKPRVLNRAEGMTDTDLELIPGLPFELDSSYATSEVSPEDESGVALPYAWGEIADITDSRFTREIGLDLYWRPYETLTTVGAGIFFIEPYDPDRTPVLFVHGAAGAPSNFETLIGSLDPERHQAWVFLYPSGLRLERLSRALAISLSILRAQYEPDRIDIVAHSMGGLVAYRSLQIARKYGEDTGVEHLITISTPWNGHAAVEGGLKYLDTPVPSWIDMRPDSAFMNSILEGPVPDGLRHHLVFGFESSMRIGLDKDNDGTVALESVLDPRAQRRATDLFGLPSGHVDILSSPELSELIRDYLPGD